jgi:hypothetical protein
MLGYRSPLGIITGFPRISSVPDRPFPAFYGLSASVTIRATDRAVEVALFRIDLNPRYLSKNGRNGTSNMAADVSLTDTAVVIDGNLNVGNGVLNLGKGWTCLASDQTPVTLSILYQGKLIASFSAEPGVSLITLESLFNMVNEGTVERKKQDDLLWNAIQELRVGTFPTLSVHLIPPISSGQSIPPQPGFSITWGDIDFGVFEFDTTGKVAQFVSQIALLKAIQQLQQDVAKIKAHLKL